MEHDISNKNCILIIDDDFINRELIKNIFSSQYAFKEATNGREGLLQLQHHLDKICAIILDVQMPELTGIELLEIISAEGITEHIPTFLITAHDDEDIVERAYALGVMDVISKPITAVVIQRRVKSVIELFQARAMLSGTVKRQEQKLSENVKTIDELQHGMLEALATAIEFRDVESGDHVNRIYGITKYILKYTAFGEGLSKEEIESIARGSIMHDVGKIAISDVILNKPGRLTREECEVMKQHTTKGAELLAQIPQVQSQDAYKYAWDIAMHHHERWDGRGYPRGLAGDEISVAAQVVSIADVYDALVSERVYKKAFTPEQAVDMIVKGQCGVFNPKLLECFLQAEPVIRKWYQQDGAGEMQESISAEAVHADMEGMAQVMADNEVAGSVMDVLLLMHAVQSTYDMIISVNLTKNSFYMVDYARFQTHCADSEGIFDDLIEAGANSVPLSHRKEFQDTFCRESLLQAYAAGKKTVVLEHQQYGDDGTLHWVETSVMFMEDSRIGDIRQITLSRYIDEEYAERERTRKVLSDALNLAEQANAVKTDFLAKMSHDIRTPLNAIIGMTTIIAANLDNREKINEALVKIGISSQYLLGIVNDILDYSRLESGKLSINMSDFNMQDMLTDISETISRQAQTKQQIVSVTVEDSVGSSYIGDEFRIRQVLMNLLDNAHKYTPEGGKYSLQVSAGRHSAEYDVLRFVVEDNGIGIREEFIEKIFDPFSQDVKTDAIDSVGLGLSITRNLAHLMNGDLAVSSEVGRGSCFTFELPLEKANVTVLSVAIDTDMHVLVVDDEIDVCEQTAILLHDMGISAETADNGFDAIRMVTANRGTEKEFDVAIIDWKMPEMDGVETVRHIRKIAGRDVLVVVMSAYDWTEIEEEARAAGVDLFLAKPILETNLRTAIACSSKIKREMEDIRFHGERVLVAEDNAFNAEVAKAILEMKNLRVDIVENGREAYDAFMAAAPGEYLAILMDILMPVMDGHEAARAIRASGHAEAQIIPIYAMTANAFHNDILEAKLAGMNGHIAKPVNFDEVARILKGILRKGV